MPLRLLSHILADQLTHSTELPLAAVGEFAYGVRGIGTSGKATRLHKGWARACGCEGTSVKTQGASSHPKACTVQAGRV